MDRKELLYKELYLSAQNIWLLSDSFQVASSHLVYFYAGDESGSCIFQDISLLKEKIDKYPNVNVKVFPIMADSREISILLKADLNGIRYKRLNELTTQKWTIS